MRHDFTISGPAYRLRPVEVDDAAFIVTLRTEPTRNRFIHYTPPDIEAQINWIQRYLEQPGDYYFIVESVQTGEREGTIGIYDIDPQQRTAEWGRWVIRPGSKAALQSLVLLFRLAFESLHLEVLRTHTVVENRGVIAILERAGMRRVRILPKDVQIGQAQHDTVEHQISRADWLGGRAAGTGRFGTHNPATT